MNEKAWIRGQLIELIDNADLEKLRILLAFTRALVK
jgi:hypothetical protein